MTTKESRKELTKLIKQMNVTQLNDWEVATSGNINWTYKKLIAIATQILKQNLNEGGKEDV
jgi:hypothetical protein